MESEIGLRSKTAQGCNENYKSVTKPQFQWKIIALPISFNYNPQNTPTTYPTPFSKYPRTMPPPTYNPSAYTAKTKSKSLTPGILALQKSNSRFTSERAKERDFQRWCQTHSGDDLVDSFGKMSIGGSTAAKK